MRFTTNLAIRLVMSLLLVGVTTALISCHREPTTAELHKEAIAIIQRLVERDRLHPIHDDFRALREKTLTGNAREEALARHRASCADFDRLRVTIQVGRPLADYAGIEGLGRHVGSDPFRFFITGFTGYVTEQGPEPHSVKIDIDQHGVITKVGVIVAAS